MYEKIPILLCLLVFYSCSSENVLTPQQAQHQQFTDEIAANTLFQREQDINASYTVHKDGWVVIKFDKSVHEKVYTEVVAELRDNKSPVGLRVERAGMEICSAYKL